MFHYFELLTGLAVWGHILQQLSKVVAFKGHWARILVLSRFSVSPRHKQYILLVSQLFRLTHDLGHYSWSILNLQLLQCFFSFSEYLPEEAIKWFLPESQILDILMTKINYIANNLFQFLQGHILTDLDVLNELTVLWQTRGSHIQWQFQLISL